MKVIVSTEHIKNLRKLFLEAFEYIQDCITIKQVVQDHRLFHVLKPFRGGQKLDPGEQGLLVCSKVP